MEAPPIKTLLVVLCMLGIFGILVGTIPSEFITEAQEYRAQDIPSEFDLVDTLQFANTYNFTNDYPTKIFSKDFGGYSLRWTSLYGAWDGYFQVAFVHYDWEFPIFGWLMGSHYVEWMGRKTGLNHGTKLGSNDVELEWNDETNSSDFTAKCRHFNMYVFWSYNLTAYATMEDAYLDDNLYVLWAIEWDELGTGLNAFNLISMILFFQLPDIHPILNMIIALPLWVCIGWLTFAFIMAVIKSLPFT